MTGTVMTPTPKTDQELMRRQDRRLGQLENPSAVRCGDWVISTGEHGELLGSYNNGGSTILAYPPDVENPDATEASKEQHLMLRLNGVSNSPVAWDTLVAAKGDWGGLPTRSGTSTQITVGKGGLYLAVVNLVWPAPGYNNGVINVISSPASTPSAPAPTGVVKLAWNKTAGSFGSGGSAPPAWVAQSLSGPVDLATGDVIAVGFVGDALGPIGNATSTLLLQRIGDL